MAYVVNLKEKKMFILVMNHIEKHTITRKCGTMITLKKNSNSDKGKNLGLDFLALRLVHNSSFKIILG